MPSAFDLLFQQPTKTSYNKRKRKPTTTTSVPKTHKSTKYTQLCLDLGQKDFSQQTTCRKCFMIYTKGIREDEKQHQKFCQTMQQSIRFKGWKNERVVTQYQQDKVLEIRAQDPKLHLQKLEQVKTRINQTLGSIPDDHSHSKRYFLYIRKAQVAGCVVVEAIESAFPISKAANQDDVIIADETNPVDVVVGVSQLWVDANFRRQGIATKLLDAVRQNFVYNMPLKKTECAFSQPTIAGRAFATKYVSPNPLLVYYPDQASLA